MTDLGTPQYESYCVLCQRRVGGPYYQERQARARLSEHRNNYHAATLGYLKDKRERSGRISKARGSFID